MKRNAIQCYLLTMIAFFSFKASGAEGFDVNDVSFLFPLKQGRPYPAVSFVSTSPALIESSVLSEVLRFEYPQKSLSELPYIGKTFLIDPAAWYITSIRYDDCGDAIETKPIQDQVSKTEILEAYRITKCQARLRLVAQPFNSAKQPMATALHLLYKLDEEENTFVIRELLAIKNSKVGVAQTQKNPLQIHPLLAEESRTESTLIADRIKNLIFTALTARQKSPTSRLQIVTMTLNTEVMGWKMVGGVVIDQRWKRFVTDYNKKFYDSISNTTLLGVESIHCNFYEFCATLPQADWQSVTLDNILTPALKTGEHGALIAPVINQETQTQAEIIDSPSRTHFFNTNCMSCHESASFRNRERLLTDPQWPTAITPFTTKTLLGDRPSTIINFGYNGMSPQVSVRVAAESAVVADRLNHILSLKNPGAQIDDMSSFWACVMSENIFQNCFSQSISKNKGE